MAIEVIPRILCLEDFQQTAGELEIDIIPSFLRAGQVLKDSHGGTLSLPPNTPLKWSGNGTIDFLGYQGDVTIVGAGGNTVIEVAQPPKDPNVLLQNDPRTGLYLKNNPKVKFKDFLFLGSQVQAESAPGYYDFGRSFLRTSQVEQVIFEDVGFIRLANTAPQDSYANGYDLNKEFGGILVDKGELILNRIYGGGNSCNENALFTLTNWNGLTIRDSRIFDHADFDGEAFTKVGGNTSFAWIRTLYPNPLTNARVRGKVKIENTRLDEAMIYGIHIIGATFVEIDNVSLNNGRDTGIVIADTPHVSIKDTFVGYTNPTNPTFPVGIGLLNCGVAEFENVELGGAVNKISLGGTTQKAIFKRCRNHGNPLTAADINNEANAVTKFFF